MVSAAPEHVDGYEPTADDAVAVVEQVAGVDGVIAGAYDAVIVGADAP